MMEESGKPSYEVVNDSVELANAVPVLAREGDDLRLVGYCELEGARERRLLRLPGTFLPVDEPVGDSVSDIADDTGADSVADAIGNRDDMNQRDWSLEQLHVLAWAIAHGAPVNLGPCDGLNRAVEQAVRLVDVDFAQLTLLVDIAEVNQEGQAALITEGAVELATIQGAEATFGWNGPSQYWLAEPILNDYACPGQYVMGQVVNRDGAPVGGIRIQMVDAWGNSAQTVSKSGDADFGRFDFPIYADGPQELSLIVMDESGNQISRPIVVPHRTDAASNTPCHFVKLQGG
jgi:hypothetical protein